MGAATSAMCIGKRAEVLSISDVTGENFEIVCPMKTAQRQAFPDLCDLLVNVALTTSGRSQM